MFYKILLLSSLAFCGMIDAMRIGIGPRNVRPTPSGQRFLTCCQSVNSISERVIKSKLNCKDFNNLLTYTQDFLQDNAHRLACQKNESGFLRISVPVVNYLSKKIEKIRVHYWPSTEEFEINPESIHSHPRYFESLIIQGGYSHAVFSREQQSGDEYAQYRLFKNGGDKTCSFLGFSKLKLTEEEFVEPGNIIPFSKDLIHQVLTTSPSTLTLNAVFKPNNPSDNQYDVYISPNGNFNDVKVEREVLFSNESQKYIKEIKEALKAFKNCNRIA